MSAPWQVQHRCLLPPAQQEVLLDWVPLAAELAGWLAQAWRPARWAALRCARLAAALLPGGLRPPAAHILHQPISEPQGSLGISTTQGWLQVD